MVTDVIDWFYRVLQSMENAVVEGRKIIDHNFVEISSSKGQLIMCVRCDNLKKTTKNPTMSRTNQPKRLGVGASCTVRLRFLHPKNKVKDVIQNQTATQQLNGLIVQSKEVKSIRREDKECIVFRHEDFGGQLLWHWREVLLWI